MPLKKQTSKLKNSKEMTKNKKTTKAKKTIIDSVNKKTTEKSKIKSIKTKKEISKSTKEKIPKKIEKKNHAKQYVSEQKTAIKKEEVSKKQNAVVGKPLHIFVEDTVSVKVGKQEEAHNSSFLKKVTIENKNSKQPVQNVIEQKHSGQNITVKYKKNIIRTEGVKFEELKNKLKNVISINELVTVKELAEKMNLKVGDVLKKLLSMGNLATINQRLDIDTATLLVNEFGYDVKINSIYSDEKTILTEEDSIKLKQRSPIVTIMGHVDHGKTSLLDAIRSSNVVAGEHGGITQHIGAYKVMTSSGHYISFLDTPGHEVFTAMRSRGAQITDIIVLVVSATDGIMPQTIEAINHAKAANVSIIVAINKIDLQPDSQKIRQELSNYGLISEEWGGDTIIIDISAKQKTNIDSLLEMILLKAEMMELKANPDKNAEGTVIEAKLDSRKGSFVTLLVQSGTLKIGDNLIVGTTYGKVRAIIDEYGKRLNSASPSTPVGILGINELPQTGDKFAVVEHEFQAREIAKSRKEKAREAFLKPIHHLSLADINMGRTKDLRIILKTDVQGSLGALSDALERLSATGISLKIIHKGSGAITESDVALAVVSDALIVGFNLRPDIAVEKLAETERVSINVYRVIYDLIADVRAAMEGLLDPDMKEKMLGKAVIKHVFKLSTYGTISGCSVVEGKIQRGGKVRLLRDNIIVFEGNISSLKRFKDDVREVEKGYECGIGLEKFSDIKIGDIIENFTTEKIARKLDS
jgi:translation initiation factor IF-2